MSKLSYRLGLTLVALSACSDPAPAGTDSDSTSSSSSSTTEDQTTTPNPTTGVPTTTDTTGSTSTTDTSSTTEPVTSSTTTTGSTTDTTTDTTTTTGSTSSTGTDTDTSTTTGSTTDTGGDQCMDGEKNGLETDTDCGGPTCSPCIDGSACVEDTDCQSMSCNDNTCGAPPPGCMDTIKNGEETDVDCGGPECPGCADTLTCNLPSDCLSGVCTDNACVAPACDDSVLNGDESDVDCGGLICSKCAEGDSCDDNADCESNACLDNMCVPPSCSDMSKNQDETDVDCGGATCEPCENDLACMLDADCVSGICFNNVCVGPSCNDGMQNGMETDVDCGGPDCEACSIPGLVINEVDYDQPSTDFTEFVEILNNTDAVINLTGYRLVFINGANDADSQYSFVDLSPAGNLDPQGYVVVGTKDTVVVPPGVFKIDFALDKDNIQNAGTDPDAIALVNTNDMTVVDALSYDGEVLNASIPLIGNGKNLVEGTPLSVIDSVANMTTGSLARIPNGYDANNADTDWQFTKNPTPGAANIP